MTDQHYDVVVHEVQSTAHKQSSGKSHRSQACIAKLTIRPASKALCCPSKAVGTMHYSSQLKQCTANQTMHRHQLKRNLLVTSKARQRSHTTAVSIHNSSTFHSAQPSTACIRISSRSTLLPLWEYNAQKSVLCCS